MRGNLNREPCRSEYFKSALRYIAGTAAVLTGAYTLSRFYIFKGLDFRKNDLTLPQIFAMDEHNQHHQDVQSVMDVSQGLLGSDAADNVNKEIIATTSKTLDAEVKDLPEPLAHTH